MAVLAASWLTRASDRAMVFSTPTALVTLCLIGATVTAYQFPLRLRPHTKVYVSSIAYFLLAVLVPPPLAATAAGIGALVGELSVRTKRGTYASDIATQVGRRVVVVLLGAWVAHVAASGAVHTVVLVAAAVVLLAGDIITFPLVLAPMSEEPPLRLMVAVARDAIPVEGAQYLIGLLGAVAVQQDYWALGLLTLPTVLVYVAFHMTAQAEEARQTAEQAQHVAQNARQQAEAAVHVRDRFLTAAAHDLRTPLTVLVGQLDLLQLQLESGQEISASWLWARMMPLQQAAARLSTTVEELTDVARVQMGQPLSLHLSAVDVAEMVRAVVGFMMAGGKTSAAAVLVDTEATADAVVLGDRQRLERVVQYVIDNAIAYSPKGTSVHVTVAAHEQHAIITVRDYGAGIPAEDLPHLFTPLHLSSTTSSRVGSSNGLAGVQTIVEQHGGQIRVESAIGCGTAVTIDLPLAPWARTETPVGAVRVQAPKLSP